MEFPVSTRWMVGGERVILGSKAHSHAEVQEGARLMIDRQVEPVISRTVTLAEAPDVLREIEADRFFARGAIDFG
jgi:D-arabinose 1-dehydrogenase-like Zn-dependent alcohol dehydrogenase